MGWRNKVVWSEGMLLQPQHFQQNERWLEHALQRRFVALSPCGWGFAEIEIDTAALLLGIPLGTLAANGIGWRGAFWLLAGLAVDPLPQTAGFQYWSNRVLGPGRLRFEACAPSADARDDDLAEQVWTLSAAALGLSPECGLEPLP